MSYQVSPVVIEVDFLIAVALPLKSDVLKVSGYLKTSRLLNERRIAFISSGLPIAAIKSFANEGENGVSF